MFIKKGDIIRKISGGDVINDLPVGKYSLAMDNNGVYIEKISMPEPNHKIYGDLEKKADRVISTYLQRENKNTGVLLRGERGSGKSLLAKIISDKMAELGNLTIIINQPVDPESLNVFINSIQNPCVIIFDEFEKTFGKQEYQEKMLTLLDGIYKGNNLYIFTINKFDYITEMLKNRPGRIFYSFDFKGISEEFIREYCSENLKNKAYTENVVKIAQMFKNFNFDMLSALVEESNRYDEDPKDFIDFMNMMPIDTTHKYYNVEIFINDIKVHDRRNFYFGFPNPTVLEFNIQKQNTLNIISSVDDETDDEYEYKIDLSLKTLVSVSGKQIIYQDIIEETKEVIKVILVEKETPVFNAWDKAF